jgi:glycosyltransferase involved in cell wall biosynthesis
MATKGGFGGTEVAFMEIGKYLCQVKGFTVHLVGFSHESYMDPSSGMQFFSEDDFDINSINTYNWYCPLFHVYKPYHYQLLNAIQNRHKTKVVLWFHCFIDDAIVQHHKTNGFDLYGIGVSEWVTQHYRHMFDEKHLWTVRNAVSPTFHQHKQIKSDMKTRGAWSFHATYDRGGAVSLRVFERVRRILPQAATQFDMMSYYTPDINHVTPSYVTRHGSLSKGRVAEILEKSEYFIYPLVTPQDHVHHDTFGCVILEALALGVIVITWNVACIPWIYSDYIVGIEPPSSYPKNQRFVRDPWFSSDEAVMRLTNAVIELEMNPARKDAIRKRGIEWAQQQTWDKSGEVMAEALVERYV